MADIISADEIKKQLPNYSPDKAEDFHHESAHQADKLFLKTFYLINYETIYTFSKYITSNILQKI